MTLLLLFICQFPISQFADPTARLKIEIAGLEHSKGQILVSIFKDAESFPRKPEKAYLNLTLKIANLSCQTEIDIPPGTYAISVVHDENGNNQVDTNWLGIPNEPLGLSNSSGKGRPDFEKAKFTIVAGEVLKLVIPVDTIF